MKVTSYPILLTLFLVLLSACASSPKSEFQTSKDCPADNTEPEYDKKPFCPQQIEANEQFLTIMKNYHDDPHFNAMHLTNGGLTYASEGDYETAIKRFNQGWLVDDTAFGPYLGFALIKTLRDQEHEEAASYFERAFALVPGDERGRLSFVQAQIECLDGKAEKAINTMEEVLSPKLKAKDLYQEQLDLCRKGSSLPFQLF